MCVCVCERITQGAYTLPMSLPYALVYSQIPRGCFQPPESCSVEWCHHSVWIKRARYCVTTGTIQPLNGWTGKILERPHSGYQARVARFQLRISQTPSGVPQWTCCFSCRIGYKRSVLTYGHSGYPLTRWNHHKVTQQRTPWPP